MAEVEKAKRKKWTKEETLLFLKCYSARKSEFEHSRKKKFAYANVLEDMVLQGFNDLSVTTVTLEAKMRTLLMAYKTAKFNSQQTCQYSAPYEAEMDEIFGDKPEISNGNTLQFDTGSIQPMQELNDRAMFCDEDSSSMPLSSSSKSTIDATSSLHPKFITSSPTTATPKRLNNSTSNSAVPSPPNPLPHLILHPRNRKTAKERYYEAKLKQRQEFLNDIKEMLREKWKLEKKVSEKELKKEKEF